MGTGNGRWVYTGQPPSPPPQARHVYAGYETRSRTVKSAVIALVLFLLTVLSTLAVGAQFALAYQEGRQPAIFLLWPYLAILEDPSLLLAGIPFSFTVLGILLAHELGHFFACRYYGIHASYPYFIPAPTLIGTMGAFIRIRSPIVNRTALFDVGVAGPVVGFLFAVPALALAILFSKVVPAVTENSGIMFGNPLLGQLLMAIFRPDVTPKDLLLHPVGRAAWVGLFATGLNLLPAGQLDGGHILYAISSQKHRWMTRAVSLALVPLSLFWTGWLLWGVLLLFLGVRHPVLMDPFEPLDRKRRVWALMAVMIFALCFMPDPIVGGGFLDFFR